MDVHLYQISLPPFVAGTHYNTVFQLITIESKGLKYHLLKDFLAIKMVLIIAEMCTFGMEWPEAYVQGAKGGMS